MTRPIFRLRAHLGIAVSRLGLWLLPPCRYKTELVEMLWVLNLRVQAAVSADRVEAQ